MDGRCLEVTTFADSAEGERTAFTAEAPRKIIKEGSNFDAAKTLHDAKFCAKHKGQHGLHPAKVIFL